MSFPLSLVPRELCCEECGTYIADLDLAGGFELLVSRVLQAKNAYHWKKGYDVYDSALVPGLTFQVKYSSPHKRKPVTKIVGGRENTWVQAPVWAWGESTAGDADIYVLFGIKDDLVYPFIVPTSIWMQESSNDGKGGRMLIMSTERYVRCGRNANSYKQTKFWQYVVHGEPDSLVDAAKFASEYYTKHPPLEQASLL